MIQGNRYLNRSRYIQPRCQGNTYKVSALRLLLVGPLHGSVKCPALAQVMISWFMGSSPMSGSVLTAQRLEPASHSEAERERDTESEEAPGSELSAQSPTWGLNSQIARS